MATGNPTGRPSIIDQVIETRPDGRTITVADKITNLLRVGAYFERACSAAGVGKATAYGWLKVAARANTELVGDPTYPLTDHQRKCISFADAVDVAEAEAEARWLMLLEVLANGSDPNTDPPISIIREWYDRNGTLTRRQVIRERILPNAQVIMWRLARRFPERYMAGRLDGTPTDAPVPDAQAAQDIIDMLEEFMAQEQAAADTAPDVP